MYVPKWIPLSVIAIMGTFAVQVVWLQQSKVQRPCEQPAPDQIAAATYVNYYHTTSARDEATTSVSDCNCSARDMSLTGGPPLVTSSTQNPGGSDVETSSMKENRLSTHYLLVVVVLSSVH